MSTVKHTRFLTGTKKQTNKNTSFVILAGSQGRRTKNYGSKILIPYKGRTNVETQIDTIRSAYGEKADIVLVTGFCAENVIDQVSNVRIVENHFYETTNTVESMRIGINACLEGSVFFIHGDLIFTSSFLNVPDTNQIYVPVDNHDRVDRSCVGLSTNNEKVLNFSYGLDTKWCQIVYFPGDAFVGIKHKLNRCDKNLTSFEFLNKLIDDRINISYFTQDKRSSIKEVKSTRDLV